MIDLARCPVCDGPADAARELLSFPLSAEGKPFPTRVVECPCGHAFSNPQPTWEELAPHYGDETFYRIEETPGSFLDRLDAWLPTRLRGDRFNHVPVVAGGRYLDVGCNLGEMVAAMGRLGMEAEGVEPRGPAAAFARGMGLKVFAGTLEAARFPDATFDCVSFFHVVEHAPDPVALLAECRRVLKPGGFALVGVPNLDSLVYRMIGPMWLGLDPPRHLHQFRAGSLARAAERAGLRVVEVSTESIPRFVEAELAKWVRRRLKVPMRWTLASRAASLPARWVARKGEAGGRGESLVALLRRDPAS